MLTVGSRVVTSDMKLAPNVGSDRSWVWNTSADYAEGEPTAETLAIRFANSDNANAFKTEFEKAQKTNESVKNEEGGEKAVSPSSGGDSFSSVADGLSHSSLAPWPLQRSTSPSRRRPRLSPLP